MTTTLRLVTETPEPEPTAPVEVGTVFYCSWGYDQTNTDFYVVTALSPLRKTATFMAVAQTATDDCHNVADATAAECERCRRPIRPLVKVSGETVWRHVDNGDERCSRYRDDDTRTATPQVFKRRLRYYSDRACANYNSYSSLYQWDGHPEYVTPSGMGH